MKKLSDYYIQNELFGKKKIVKNPRENENTRDYYKAMYVVVVEGLCFDIKLRYV